MPPGAYPGLMDLPEVAEIVAATMVAGTHYSADWFPVPMPVVAPRPVVRSIIAVSQSRGPKVDNLAAGFVGLFDVNDFRCRRLLRCSLLCPFERQPLTFQPFPMQALPLIGNGIVVGCGFSGSADDVGNFDLC